MDDKVKIRAFDPLIDLFDDNGVFYPPRFLIVA